jgi:predicted transcriptional regulator
MQRLKGYWLTKMEAKVLEHLDERKTPRSAKQMAEYFGVSRTSITKATHSLHGMELITSKLVGRTHFFRIKHGYDTRSKGQEACCRTAQAA